MSMQQEIKTLCGMCPFACGIIVHLEDGKIIDIKGDPDHPWNKGKLCPKGAGILDHVNSPDRVRYPMKKVRGEWERISWDEALNIMVFELNRIKENYGAKSWVGLVGMPFMAQGFTSLRLFQRFCDVFGSPNYLTPESMCYLSRITAAMITLGTFPAADTDNTKCILLWGHNPSESNFFEAKQILRAKENGAKLMVIDPRRTALAKQADIHAQIRPGSDCALALAMINVIISENLYDQDFVSKWTIGFDKLKDHVKTYTPKNTEKITWIPAKMIEDIARTYASVHPACILQGFNTLDLHPTGFQNHRSIFIMQAITGNIDVPGGFVTPDLGGPHVASLPNYADLRLTHLMKDETIGKAQYPLFVQDWSGQGMLLPDMILTGKPYPVKGLMVSGSNPFLTWPNNNKMKKALEQLDFLAVMSVTMNETAQLADLVLPAASFLERTEVWEILNMGLAKPFLNLRNKVIDYHESWPDVKFWLELGKKMGYEEYFPWKDTDEVLKYVLAPSGLDIGSYIGKTNCIPYGELKYRQYEQKGFKTPSGKVELYSEIMSQLSLDPLPSFIEPPESPSGNPQLAKDFPLILTTGSRNLLYTHSAFREISRFGKKMGEPYAEIHPCTAGYYQVGDGDLIIVETRRGAIEIKARLTEDILPHVMNIPHGWAQNNVNVLTDETSCDPVTGYPALKALLCRIRVK